LYHAESICQAADVEGPSLFVGNTETVTVIVLPAHYSVISLGHISSRQFIGVEQAVPINPIHTAFSLIT